MYSKKPLVHTTENMVKEGINDMKKKCNVVDKAITHHKKEKIDTINEIDKPHILHHVYQCNVPVPHQVGVWITTKLTNAVLHNSSGF